MEACATVPTMSGRSPLCTTSMLPTAMQTLNPVGGMPMGGINMGAYQSISSIASAHHPSSHGAASLVLGEYHSL